MRRDSFFWGLALIILGLLFFLKAQNILVTDVLGTFWPILLILFGIWMLVSVFSPASPGQGDTFSIDAQGASEAAVEFNHGAGRIEIAAGAGPGLFMTGSAGRGMSHSSRLVGSKLEVEVDAGPTFVPFLGPEGGVWRFQLSSGIPMSLMVSAGASEINLDLTGLRITYLKLETGASATSLKLPAQAGGMVADVEAGAASLDVRVPEGVEARIRFEGGLASVNIDQSRFARQGDFYQSSGYAASANRLDLNIEAGAGSIHIA